MCGGSVWLMEGWRPWADLTADPEAADAALARDNDNDNDN
jgi:hypothetical protein